jgi:protein TonB
MKRILILLVIALVVAAFSQTEQVPPSNGTGAGREIGGGIAGSGGGFGSGVAAYHVGGRVIAPKIVYRVDPKFSEEGRQKKRQGTVVLRMIVGVDGNTRDIKVLRSLDMELDEKAVEAVRLWRFEPGTRDGKAVPVEVNVVVNFRKW